MQRLSTCMWSRPKLHYFDQPNCGQTWLRIMNPLEEQCLLHQRPSTRRAGLLLLQLRIFLFSVSLGNRSVPVSRNHIGHQRCELNCECTCNTFRRSKARGIYKGTADLIQARMMQHTGQYHYCPNITNSRPNRTMVTPKLLKLRFLLKPIDTVTDQKVSTKEEKRLCF